MARKYRSNSDTCAEQRLTTVAERLFGLHGLDGISLRQISLAAGYGNNYAVQYHFGDAAGLIRAILKRRMPEVELRRAELLATTKQLGRIADTRALTDILYLPLIRYGEEQGERYYARFILALQNAPVGIQFSREHFELMPIATHVIDLMHAANPHIPVTLIGERQRMISIMVLTSIFNRRPPFDEPQYDAALIENVMQMATAALVAPLDPNLQSIIARGKA